jgi:hypothetical protein
MATIDPAAALSAATRAMAEARRAAEAAVRVATAAMKRAGEVAAAHAAQVAQTERQAG